MPINIHMCCITLEACERARHTYIHTYTWGRYSHIHTYIHTYSLTFELPRVGTVLGVAELVHRQTIESRVHREVEQTRIVQLQPYIHTYSTYIHYYHLLLLCRGMEPCARSLSGGRGIFARHGPRRMFQSPRLSQCFRRSPRNERPNSRSRALCIYEGCISGCVYIRSKFMCVCVYVCMYVCMYVWVKAQ